MVAYGDRLNMIVSRTLLGFSLAVAGLIFLLYGCSQANAITRLPPPGATGGKSVMEALQLRRTTREFTTRELPDQVLSDLVWAAFGINRPESGERTAPTAWGEKGIDILVFTAEGVFRYAPEEHGLETLLEGDLRELAGTADFVTAAPVTLVYLADHSRTPETAVWEKEKYAYVHTGAIGQNVYLYCASAGLGTVIHDSTPKGALAGKLGLRKDQQIILAQTVGYPSP